MDKVLVRFLRQLLLIILLHDSEKDIRTVFSVVLKSLKLHALKEGLVLFMHHFMLKNKDKLPLDAHEKLESRIELVDKILNKL